MCFRSMQSTERGKKVNAALVQTGKVVAQTGKAVGKENIVIFQKFTINDAGVCVIKHTRWFVVCSAPCHYINHCRLVISENCT